MNPRYIVNECVKDGYKPFGVSTVESLKMMFQRNNELMNVLTSILGIVVILGWMVYIYSIIRTKQQSVRTKMFTALLFFAGLSRVAIWIFSLLGHTFSTHKSTKLVEQLWKFDLISIYINVVGFSMLYLFIEAYDHISLSVFSITSLVGTLASIGTIVYVLTHPDIHNESHRAFRTLPWIFIVTIFSVPVLWKLYTIGSDKWTPWFIIALACYFVGGFFFVTKFPECFVRWRGLEMWSLSHHWWHWANILGDSAYFLGVAKFATSI